MSDTQVPCQPDRPYDHLEAVAHDRGLVILGRPDQLRPLPEDQEETFGHNCDAMGCGQSHVLFRVDLRDFLFNREEGLRDRHRSDIDGLEERIGELEGALSSAGAALKKALRHLSRSSPARQDIRSAIRAVEGEGVG